MDRPAKPDKRHRHRTVLFEIASSSGGLTAKDIREEFSLSLPDLAWFPYMQPLGKHRFLIRVAASAVEKIHDVKGWEIHGPFTDAEISPAGNLLVAISDRVLGRRR